MNRDKPRLLEVQPLITFCHHCGVCAEECDLFRFGELAVCAVCKPELVQRLREGGSIGGPRTVSNPKYVRSWGGHTVRVEVEYSIKGLWYWAENRLWIDEQLAGRSCRPGFGQIVKGSMNLHGETVPVELRTHVVWRKLNYVRFEIWIAGVRVDYGFLKATHRFASV